MLMIAILRTCRELETRSPVVQVVRRIRDRQKTLGQHFDEDQLRASDRFKPLAACGPISFQWLLPCTPAIGRRELTGSNGSKGANRPDKLAPLPTDPFGSGRWCAPRSEIEEEPKAGDIRGAEYAAGLISRRPLI